MKRFALRRKHIQIAYVLLILVSVSYSAYSAVRLEQAGREIDRLTTEVRALKQQVSIYDDTLATFSQKFNSDFTRLVEILNTRPIQTSPRVWFTMAVRYYWPDGFDLSKWTEDLEIAARWKASAVIVEDWAKDFHDEDLIPFDENAFRALVDSIRGKGLKVYVYFWPIAISDGSSLMESHPEYVIRSAPLAVHQDHWGTGRKVTWLAADLSNSGLLDHYKLGIVGFVSKYKLDGVYFDSVTLAPSVEIKKALLDLIQHLRVNGIPVVTNHVESRMIDSEIAALSEFVLIEKVHPSSKIIFQVALQHAADLDATSKRLSIPPWRILVFGPREKVTPVEAYLLMATALKQGFGVSFWVEDRLSTTPYRQFWDSLFS